MGPFAGPQWCCVCSYLRPFDLALPLPDMSVPLALHLDFREWDLTHFWKAFEIVPHLLCDEDQEIFCEFPQVFSGTAMVVTYLVFTEWHETLSACLHIDDSM